MGMGETGTLDVGEPYRPGADRGRRLIKFGVTGTFDPLAPSLDKCPQCGYDVAVRERMRVDWSRIRCPKCKTDFPVGGRWACNYPNCHCGCGHVPDGCKSCPFIRTLC